MRKSLHVPLLAVLALAASCGHRTRTVVVHDPRLVSIEVEVYDPVTDGVWENVGVRVVEASVESSACTCENRFADDFFLTDARGLVYFSAGYLADADLGFLHDRDRRAILSPRGDSDEATVLLEVWADGFEPVFVEVRLSWDHPDAFVSVPFE